MRILASSAKFALSIVFVVVAALFCGHFCVVFAANSDLDQRHMQAEALIQQAREFRKNAADYHAAVEAQSKDAQKLGAQAGKLSSSTRKLNARIQQVELNGHLQSDASKYNLHLHEFSAHSKLYNSHLADYEKQVLKAQAAAGQLKSSCNQYADHAQTYHIPGVRPPHICVQLQYEQSELQKAARGFQADQLKSQQAEAALAGQEAQLAQAARERIELQNKLLQKADLEQLERTQGAMLLKEYQQVEREYRLLQLEKKSVAK
ncbi:MAG: hypothetical protein K2X81_26465 [Candidatus Obscuribacterales bacterium]|nr:hypothetical protein [Candidatus Obscuribacterales bacterium]